MSFYMLASFSCLSANSLPFIPNGLCPEKFFCPVAFPKGDSELPDFLYEVVVIVCVLEGLKCDSAVCVYCCRSWNRIFDV